MDSCEKQTEIHECGKLYLLVYKRGLQTTVSGPYPAREVI